jgi:hypothetical protein
MKGCQWNATWKLRTVPELLFEKKQLIPVLQQLLVSLKWGYIPQAFLPNPLDFVYV